MSVPTYQQSSQVPLSISENGTDYLSVVCKRSYNFNFDTPVNEEDSDCGVAVGLGAKRWSVDFEGAVNKTPNSGSEISAKQMLDYWLASTLLYIKTTTGVGGSNVFVSGQGYVTNLVLTNQTNNVMSFTFTFTGEGDPDLTP